jgi:heptaprenyl diphosphate synthase
VLLALYILGPVDGFFVVLIKVIIGSFFSGRFLSPFFVFALGAGLPAYWVMAGVKAVFGRWLGPVGVSVTGAVSHNMFQLVIAYFLVVHSLGVFYLAPVLVVIATLAGAVIGITVRAIIPRIEVDSGNNKRRMSK